MLKHCDGFFLLSSPCVPGEKVLEVDSHGPQASGHMMYVLQPGEVQHPTRDQSKQPELMSELSQTSLWDLDPSGLTRAEAKPIRTLYAEALLHREALCAWAQRPDVCVNQTVC